MNIQTRWEEITPKKAAGYLTKNVSNRPLREATLSSYVADMQAGHWLETHQGIAFNDRDELMDGQHRLTAIVRSEMTVRMLVTRGVPALVGGDHTMDTVDRGASRSIADQLRLQHGFTSPNFAIGVMAVVASLALVSRVRKQTVAQVLAALEIYGRHISEVEKPIVNQQRDRRFRRAGFGGAIAFARSVEPGATDRFVKSVLSGAGLESGQAALTLRNYILRPDGEAQAGMVERLQLGRIVLNAIHAAIENQPWPRVIESRGGLIYFASRQQPQIAKLAEIYQSTPASLEPDKPGKARKDLTPLPKPPRLITAKNFQLTPAAENLLRGISMSERAHRKAGDQ